MSKKNAVEADIANLPDYFVKQRIGEGMLGSVYKAVDSRSEKNVALKVLRPEATQYAQQLQNEFRLLSTLHHPHLADVFDYGITDSGRPFYAMEWIKGEPVNRDVFLGRDGEFNNQLFAEFVRQMTSALMYLGSRNIAHGDIKPENILITKERDLNRFSAVLVDFGISRSYTSESRGLSGTFEYIAPEIIRGESPSAASDLYSLGCVLYELVEGTPPFNGESPLEILKQHLHSSPEKISKQKDIDTSIAGWISTLLEKDIRLRYRNPEQLYLNTCEFLGKEPDEHIREQEAVPVQLVHIPRENEQAKFTEIASEADTGFQLLTIEAAEGMGKSWLLNDFKVQYQLEGHRSYALSNSSYNSTFGPVTALLRNCDITDDSRDSASIVASFFPEVFPDVEPEKKAGMDADGEIMRLFHAAAILISGLAIDGLFIDDLDELDDLTLEFLAYFISFEVAQDTHPMLLVATLNPESINRDLFPVKTQQMGAILPLQPLNKEVVKQNIDVLFGGDMTPSFHSFVWNQSRGNPAQVEDILQYCIDEGIIERTRHGWIVHEREDIAKAVPTSMVEKARHRIGKLTENATQLLKALALADYPVEPRVLEYVLRKGIDRIHELGIKLIQSDLIDLVEGKYKCRAELVRSLLDYSTDQAVTFHERYVEYYTNHPETAPETGQLAEHYLGAGNSEKAAEMFIAASRESERIYDYAQTRRYLAKAIEIPGAFTDDDELFNAYQSMARMCNILGDRDRESEYIEELLILAGRWKNKKGALRLAKAYDLQTEFNLSLGDFDRATRSAERALRYYEEANNILGIAHCQQKLGFILYRTKPTPEVLEYYHTAREKYSAQNHALDEANILIDIGLVYYSILNNPDEALRCYDEARSKFMAAGMERGAARAYGNAGVQYFALGDYENALEMHRKANEIFDRIGDFRSTGLSKQNIGKCLTAIGQHLHAIMELESAYKIGKTLSDSYLQENCLEDLGDAYHYLGQFDTAEKYFLQAKEIAVQTGYTLGEITNTLDVAELLIEQNNATEALSYTRQASTMLETVKNSRVEGGCIYRFAQIHSARGDHQDYSKALDYYNRLAEISEENDFEDYRILAYSYAGLCHAHLGHLRESLGQSEHALRLLEEARDIIGGKQDILLNHARILRANKQNDDAEEFIQRAYDEVMRIASYIEDPKYYRSFTENVSVNAEIIREYSLLHRTDSPESRSISRDQNLRTLYDVARKINSVLDLPQLLENIMDSALEAMNGERGLIFLLENNDLVLKASRNVEKETIKDATEISLSILKDVVSGGKPIIIADTSQDDEVKKRESVVNYNIHSIICVPMKSKDEIVGTVYVDSRSDALSAMSFSEIDADFLIAFANLATIAIENARLHTKLRQENLYLKQEVTRQFGFENIVGASKPMEHLFRETQGAIASEDSVLVYGESGTGKELIARAIHYNGKRKDRRFVAVDCGAFQDTLLESELFGYKRGAFTGAVADKRGLFEEAHKGTLFLDEISNTSLAFQAKLLRVLQSGEFRRVGDTETRKVDVRIIAATNTDLQKQILTGAFRQDLYYRLNVIPIHLPELRDRLDDIPLLVQHFISEYNKKHGTNFKGATKELLDDLQSYTWPGNVRELENLISRMLVQADNDIIGTKNLPADFSTNTTGTIRKKEGLTMKVPTHLKALKDLEKEHILHVLNHTGNNKTEAAKILGLKRTTLVERMKKLGLM